MEGAGSDKVGLENLIRFDPANTGHLEMDSISYDPKLVYRVQNHFRLQGVNSNFT